MTGEGREGSADLGIDGFEDPVEIGHGGFATVYRATQTAMHREVAIKLLPGVDAETARRFERECRAVGAVSDHPNIVSAHDSGTTSAGRPYLVMDYFPGGSLAKKLAQGTLPWEDAIGLGIKLAGALETAHRSGVLHRDIKPENVLLSSYGEPSLADFGIAVVRGGTETRTGAITASLAHSAPEVMSGERADESADVYSLASTVYALIVGRSPFSRSTDETLHPIITRALTQPVPDLRPEGVPDGVCTVLEAAMAKTPGERTRSAEAFGRSLQDAQRAAGLPVTEMLIRGDAVEDTGPPAPVEHDLTGMTFNRPRPDRSPVVTAPVATSASKRRPIAIAAGVLVVVLALVGAGITLTGNGNKAEAASAELQLLKATDASGFTADRLWTLNGTKGDTFTSKVTMTNTTPAPITARLDEVVPKALAASVYSITFSPAFNEVVQADPIVRYTVPLDPAAHFEFTYQIKVPTAGATKERLIGWAMERDRAVHEHDPNAAAATPPGDVAAAAAAQLASGGSPTGGPTGGSTGTGSGSTGGGDSGGSAQGGTDGSGTTTGGGTTPISGTGGDATANGGSGTLGGDTTTSGNTTTSRDTTTTRAPAPATPKSPVCTPGQASVSFTWSAVSGAAKYRVFDHGSATVRDERTTNSATINGLAPNTPYSFDVRAVGGDDQVSGIATCPSVTTPKPPPLAPPSPVTVSSGEFGVVTVSWPAGNGAKSYQLFRSTGALVTTTTATTFKVQSPPCTANSFQVATVDSYDQVGAKSAVSTGTTGNHAPTAVNGAQGLRSGQYHPGRSIAAHAGDADANIVSYDVIEIGFSASTFKFTWHPTTGTFDITVPAGNGGSSYIKWRAHDSCGAVSAIVTETLDFVN